jgi:hypothetical protein
MDARLALLGRVFFKMSIYPMNDTSRMIPRILTLCPSICVQHIFIFMEILALHSELLTLSYIYQCTMEKHARCFPSICPKS